MDKIKLDQSTLKLPIFGSLNRDIFDRGKSTGSGFFLQFLAVVSSNLLGYSSLSCRAKTPMGIPNLAASRYRPCHGFRRHLDE